MSSSSYRRQRSVALDIAFVAKNCAGGFGVSQDWQLHLSTAARPICPCSAACTFVPQSSQHPPSTIKQNRTHAFSPLVPHWAFVCCLPLRLRWDWPQQATETAIHGDRPVQACANGAYPLLTILHATSSRTVWHTLFRGRLQACYPSAPLQAGEPTPRPLAPSVHDQCLTLTCLIPPTQVRASITPPRPPLPWPCTTRPPSVRQ